MTNSEALTLLKEWLEVDGNTTLKIAAQLGYKTNTPHYWVKTGKIPNYAVNEVLRIIGKKVR